MANRSKTTTPWRCGNVQRLAEERWERLEKFVRRGGGLVVFGGDLVSADNYNRFAFREGNGVLPGRIDAAGAGDDTAVGFASDALAHELVSEFRDRPTVVCSSRASNGIYRSNWTSAVRTSCCVTRDGEPAIVASTLDRGRVVLFTTTANMDWSNLPAKGDYVSLMLNTFAHVAPRARRPRNIPGRRFDRRTVDPGGGRRCRFTSAPRTGSPQRGGSYPSTTYWR